MATINASQTPSGTDRHTAAAVSGCFISLLNYRLFFCPLLSHDPLCDIVHCCPLRAVQKHGRLRWHAACLGVELSCKWGTTFGSGLQQANQLGNEL